MSPLIDKIKKYFTGESLPHSAFQISSHCLSGIHVSPKEKKIKRHFFIPLERDIIQAAFDKKNIQKPHDLQEKVKQGLERLHLSDHKIACLIPEMALKVFVFSFSSFPASQREREQFVRFWVKKQIPLLPDDIRFSLDKIKSNNSVKAIVSVARASVIREYEDFFDQLRLKVRVIGVPTLCLHNLISKEGEKNMMLLNVEQDFLTLIAIVDSEIALYRLKPFILESASKSTVSGSREIGDIVKEVENTIHFIEDREKKKVHSLWVRLGVLESGEEILSILQKKLSIPLKGIEQCLPSELSLKEKTMLSPLIGQIL